jgi:predicted MFS family arabinose efflux permease
MIANRHYILVMVTLVFVVNYLDRQILGILLPLIKAEFHATDTQLGILTGPAFALIYATLGMPFAVIADRANRRNIIAISLAIFSAMTVVCNFVASFWQLVAARSIVGVGEAGTGPSINSIIADLYPPQQRASALAFYSAGLNVGLLVAFFGGGIIAGTFGWRAAFLASGIPGLILVFLFLFTVPEPARGHSEALVDTGDAPGFMATVRYLWSQRSFRYLSLGTSMSAFSGYAGLAFVPSFLARTHHLTPVQIGLLLATTTGVFGYIGTLLSGVIADRVGRKDIRRTMLVPVVATFIGLPFAPVFYLSPNLTVVIVALALPAFDAGTRAVADARHRGGHPALHPQHRGPELRAAMGRHRQRRPPAIARRRFAALGAAIQRCIHRHRRAPVLAVEPDAGPRHGQGDSGNIRACHATNIILVAFSR